MNSIGLVSTKRLICNALSATRDVTPRTLWSLPFLFLSAVAHGQGAPGTPDRTAGTPPMERVSVVGKSRAQLQREIELTTEALFERFNEINSNRDFDTVCRERTVTGSKLSRTDCQPRFAEKASANAGRQQLQALQGFGNEDGSVGAGMGAESGLSQFEARVQMEAMGDEMKRLINEDEEFRALAARLGTLQQALAEDEAQRGESGRTSATIASAADAPLPYDAQLMAEVSVGRNAWEHTLIHRTFAIAHLYGAIDSMNLRCGKERARLEYELEAEWTVPGGWEDCRLTIDAPRGTTFTLFEFD